MKKKLKRKEDLTNGMDLINRKGKKLLKLKIKKKGKIKCQNT